MFNSLKNGGRLAPELILNELAPRSGPAPSGRPYAPFGMALNDLDKGIIDLSEGTIGVVDFLEILSESQILVVTKEGDVDVVEFGYRLKESAELFAQNCNGAHHVAVFTDQIRGGIAPMISPAFNCSILMPFKDLFVVFEKYRVGFIINPFFEMNLAWNPDQAKKIVREVV